MRQAIETARDRRHGAGPARAGRALVVAAGLALSVAAAPASAQPSFSKAFLPNTIGPGSVSTLQFTIANDGGTPATMLAFADTLPAGVTIASPAAVVNTCNGTVTAPDGGGTITLADGDVGGNQVCTVAVDVTSSTVGVHMNVSGDLTSSAGNSGTASADLTVATDRPGFSKSFSPASVPRGDRSTLTFTIDNTLNASVAAGLTFTDNLPLGIEVADPAAASTTCTGGVLTAVPGSSVVSYGTTGFVPAASICTIIVDVKATGTGELDNVSGELTSFTGVTVRSSGKASATLEATTTPLALTKEFTDDAVPPGGTVTLELTVSNLDRDFPATGIAFTDDLTALVPPLAGLTFSSLLSNDCGGVVTGVGGTTVALTGGTLAASASCTVRVSLSVPAAAVPGTYVNTTSAVTGTVGVSPVVGNQATDTLFVSAAPLLTKTFLDATTMTPDPVVSGGDSVLMRFSITNSSSTDAATGITFLDDLTAFLPFPISAMLPATPCGAGSSAALVSLGIGRQGLQLTGGNLAAAGSCTFDVTLNLPVGLPAGVYVNTTGPITATVGGDTATGPPASDDFVVVGAPGLDKEFTDDPALPGGTVTLEFTLTYPAEAAGDATGVTFTDDLAATLAGLTATGLPLTDLCGPGNGTLTGSAGDTLLTFSGATLMPGDTCTFSVVLAVPAAAPAGSHANTTSDVAATVLGVATTGAGASDDLRIAGLVLTKEFTDDPVIPGGTVTLEFMLRNISPTEDATGITFTDSLAGVLAGLVFNPGSVPATPCGAGSAIALAAGNTFLTLTGGNLLAGAMCTFSVTLDVPAGAASDTYLNTTSSVTATVGGSPALFDPASDLLVVNGVVLEVTKEFIDDPVAPGDTVTLEFTITNLDPVNEVSDVGFTDDVDATLAGLQVTGLVPGSNSCAPAPFLFGLAVGSTLTVFDGNLPGGSSCSFQALLPVPAGATPGVYPNTTSVATGTVGGLPVTGDPATDDLVVASPLGFRKSFDNVAVAGGTRVLSFTIENPDPANGVSGISFSDDLDAVVTGLVATGLPAAGVCGAGSTLAGTSLLTLTGGSLGPGGSCSFDVVVQVPAGTVPGVYPNTTSALTAGGLEVGAPASHPLTVVDPVFLFIDDFLDPQAEVVAPGSSTQDVVDGIIVGKPGERDLAVPLIGGGGGGGDELFGSTAEVTGGALQVFLSGRFEEVVVTWDGDDSSSSFNPTAPGLEDTDLTAAGQLSAFRLPFSAVTGTVGVIVEVFSGGGADSSRAAAVVSTTGDLFLDFSSFGLDVGAGVDFSAVDAVTMRMLSDDGATLTLDEVRVVRPEIAASKVDLDAGGTPLTSAAPGDTIRYDATISSSGGGGEGVTFEDTVGTGTTLQGTFTSTPLARDDLYELIAPPAEGGLQLTVPAPGVLTNDEDFDGGSLTVTTVGMMATSEGGTVDLAADGSFTYTAPSPEFNGVDSFDYSVVDDETDVDSATAVIVVQGEIPM